MNLNSGAFRTLCGTLVASSLLLAGCGRKADSQGPQIAVTPPKPQEAANQIEQAFSSTPEDVKGVANVASQALRTADYEAAVQSLGIIKEKGNLTFEQGLAVHNSMVSLEAKLIAAAEAGDPNAKRAYEQLKRARRK